MTNEQAGAIYGRIAATWPPKQPPTPAEVREWLDFLRPFTYDLSGFALDDLRNQLGWKPSMADFRAAYKAAAKQPGMTAPALPAGDDADDEQKLADRYGTQRSDWVYCWKCDMAITLEERATAPHYRPGRGLYHRQCPKSGTSPYMPQYLRLEREEWQERRRRKIAKEADASGDEFGGVF